MRQNWTCSKCFQKFSRKWNLERHLQLIHGEGDQRRIFETNLENKLYGKSSHVYNQKNLSSPGIKDYFADLFDLAEMQNKMSNSNQTFGQLHSLQWQVGALQQQLAYLRDN